MAVFVTDGKQRSTLAVVRSLGRAGIPVTVGAAASASLAGCSRYCAGTARYPSPVDDTEGFCEFLRQQMSGGQYKVLLPMTDVTVALAAGMHAELDPLVALPIPGAAQVRQAQDKREVLLLAQRLGVPCPRTFMLDEQERLQDAVEKAAFPVVIKPRFSRLMRDGRWVSGGVDYACDARELATKYDKAHGEIPFPLVQEKIQGEGRGVFLLLWDGKLKAAFCHRRLREKPPWGGVSVYCESLPLDQELVEKSVALLRAIGWQGVAMVEFKLDQGDGLAKLMEVNGRFWGSLQLAIDAGMNFPLLLYRLASGEKVEPQFAYQPGVKSRWLLGDLDHLWIRLTHARAPNGFSSGSRLRACADFLKFYEKGMRYEVLRMEDPGPGWYECKDYVRGLLGVSHKEKPGAR